jgi:hypothetical protein
VKLSNRISSLGIDFKRLDAKDQRGIFFCLSLSAFLQHCIENDFVPIIEKITKTKCTGDQRTKIVSELATAMLASCHFPNDKAFAGFFGCDPELLRGIAMMLILTESDEPRKVLNEPSYTRDRNEARAQAVSAVLRILGVSDKGPIEQLSGVALAKKWNEFCATLIPGALTGMKGMPPPAMIDAALQRIGHLPPWSKAVVREYMKRIKIEASNSRNAN